jgi:hypothetical protein
MSELVSGGWFARNNLQMNLNAFQNNNCTASMYKSCYQVALAQGAIPQIYDERKADEPFPRCVTIFSTGDPTDSMDLSSRPLKLQTCMDVYNHFNAVALTTRTLHNFIIPNHERHIAI